MGAQQFLLSPKARIATGRRAPQGSGPSGSCWRRGSCGFQRRLDCSAGPGAWFYDPGGHRFVCGGAERTGEDGPAAPWALESTLTGRGRAGQAPGHRTWTHLCSLPAVPDTASVLTQLNTRRSARLVFIHSFIHSCIQTFIKCSSPQVWVLTRQHQNHLRAGQGGTLSGPPKTVHARVSALWLRSTG